MFYLAVALVVFGGDVAKTFRGEDFEDDGAIAKEHHRKWNECAQHEVYPVPRSEHERHKMVLGITDHIGVCDISTFGTMTWRSTVKKKCILAPNSNKQMTVHAITMRRREHSSLHLNGIQTEMRRSDVSKINAHEDTCTDSGNWKMR